MRMPAESAPHARTLMCWPARGALYGELMADAEAAHAEVATAIAAFEPVTMVAAPGTGDRAVDRCGGGIDVVELPIDDSWARDTGPIYVVDDDGTLVALDFAFNAWGRKYAPWDDDDALAQRLAAHTGHRAVPVPMVLEGGAVAVDGAGTLVTTEQCLMHPNRNPELSRIDIEGVLAEYLGAGTTVWLPYGLALDDDTDGHVDNIAACASQEVLVMQGCSDTDEVDWLRCNVNQRCAKGALDAGGTPIEVVDVPVLPFTEIGGERVAVPYLNFYVGNGFVAVPTCGHDADGDMLALIGDQFPGREVLGLDVGAILAYGGGGIHCITQQIPRLD